MSFNSRLVVSCLCDGLSPLRFSTARRLAFPLAAAWCFAAWLVVVGPASAVRAATEWVEYDKLTASDGAIDDWFGNTVGISGDTAIVGARNDDDGGSDSGSAYLFDVTTGNELSKLTASDAAAGDYFAGPVAISGNTAIVGAERNDDAGSMSGSAYLFDVTTGNQLFKLTASDAAYNDQFGGSVGISGNTAIVGAWLHDNAGYDSGSAYLFDATTGNQLFKLTASDAAAGDHFGLSVGIDGNIAIVGAYGNDDAGSNSGSAYLFDVTTGNQLFKLTASDAAAADIFGYSPVAISGNIAIVGATGNDDAGSESGSVYLFDVTTGNELFKLTASDAAAGDNFGNWVAISGNTAIVGATKHDDAGSDSGSAYLFDVTTGTELQKLTASDAAAGDRFGQSLAIDGDTVIVGAHFDDDAGDESGSVYLFERRDASTLLKLNGRPITDVELGQIVLAPGDTLSGGGIQNGVLIGAAGSAIVADAGDMSLGKDDAYDGFRTDGTIDTGTNTLTLRSKGFAKLGSLTTIGGGSLAAPNGVALGVGDNVVGSGGVTGKVAAAFGSTIEATGPLALGDAAALDGFFSDGSLLIGGNTVTLNDRNEAVLGSLTEIAGGTLVAPNGFLLENGKNLSGAGQISKAAGPATVRFVNRGYVEGPDTPGQWLAFDLLFQASTGRTAGNLGFLEGYAPGDSPGLEHHDGNMELGGTSPFELGGETPGNGDGHYSQLNVSGNLTLVEGATISVEPWGGYVPQPGDVFTVLTWGGEMTGAAAVVVDPWFPDQGIHFDTTWNDGSLVLTAVPEPSALALAAIGLLGLLAWRRRDR